jgi:predicted nuclease with TOPRIM domain
MENNQQGNAEKFFKDFGKKLDQFMVELQDASNRMEIDLKKKFEELKTAGENLRKDASNKQRWKEVEDSLKKASKEMENAFRSAFKKQPGKKD